MVGAEAMRCGGCIVAADRTRLHSAEQPYCGLLLGSVQDLRRQVVAHRRRGAAERTGRRFPSLVRAHEEARLAAAELWAAAASGGAPGAGWHASALTLRRALLQLTRAPARGCPAPSLMRARCFRALARPKQGMMHWWATQQSASSPVMSRSSCGASLLAAQRLCFHIRTRVHMDDEAPLEDSPMS